MTTGQSMAKLKELAGKAGQSIRERLALCRDILGDKDYVTSTWGDESKALETLEADCFGDLCGARSLGELLQLYTAFDEEAWKCAKWNLTRLLAEWDARPREKGEKREVRRVTLKEHDEVKQQLAEAKYQAKAAQEDVASLRERLREVERENIQLVARVQELENLLDRYMPAVAARR